MVQSTPLFVILATITVPLSLVSIVLSAGNRRSISDAKVTASPLQQMSAFPANWGQCIDIGLSFQLQRHAETGSVRAYSDYMAWGPTTEEDIELVCGAMGDGATVLAQGVGETGRFRNPLSDDFTKMVDMSNDLTATLPLFTGFLNLPTRLTLADAGITAANSPGARYAKVYGLLWYMMGMTAVSHPFVAFGLDMGPVVASDGIVYDGTVQGKGPCTHHKAVTHLDSLGFGSGTGETFTGYLNLRWYFKNIDGVMKVMRQEHVGYATVETVPVPAATPLLPVSPAATG